MYLAPSLVSGMREMQSQAWRVKEEAWGMRVLCWTVSDLEMLVTMLEAN